MSFPIVQYAACEPGSKCSGDASDENCAVLNREERALAVAEDLCPANLRRSLGTVAAIPGASPDTQIAWQLTEIGLAESDPSVSKIAFNCARDALHKAASRTSLPLDQRLRAEHDLHYLPIFEDRRLHGQPRRETIHGLYREQGQILAEIIAAAPGICSSRTEATARLRGLTAEVASGALITRKAGPTNMVYASSTREDFGTNEGHLDHDYYKIVSPGVKAAIQVKFSIYMGQYKPASPMDSITTIYLSEICESAVRSDQPWRDKVRVVVDLLIKESSGHKLSADERHTLDRATNAINNKIKARSTAQPVAA